MVGLRLLGLSDGGAWCLELELEGLLLRYPVR
jgi:hypothetical protein